MTSWDESYDVVVIGSGAAGLTSALTASLLGGRSVVLEKSGHYGGTSAMSGGAVWVPCNHRMEEAGIDDDPDAAFAYLRAVSAGRVSEARHRAYVTWAPRMAAHLEADSRLEWVLVDRYPDYYDREPGAHTGGRMLVSAAFDGTVLDGELHAMRKPHPQMSLVLGASLLDHAGDATSMIGTDLASRWFATRRVARWVMDAPKRMRVGSDFRLSMGAALIGRLRRSLMDRDVPLLRDTAVREILRDGSRISGVLVEQAGASRRLQARCGVVIATGGFGHNEDLRKRFFGEPTSARWTASSPTDTGDGLALAQEVGAALGCNDVALWTPVAVIPNSPVAWPVLLERCGPGSLLVDGAGERFVNEAAPFCDVVNAMRVRHRPEHPCIPAWLVFDARFRFRYPAGPALPSMVQPDFLLSRELRRSLFKKGRTIAELADKLGVARPRLASTIARFNAFAVHGDDPDFGRGQTPIDRFYGDPNRLPNPCLAPLERAPFYAMAVYPGDMGTLGGVVADEWGRVLEPDGAPIEGLFASGNCSVPLMGPTYAASGGTLGPGMTFGYLAARSAMRATTWS